jgi:uncharacterized protein DUF4192
MSEVYTASTMVDIIDALPTLFGFTPQESFVGITTQGPRRRFGFRLRLDLPEIADTPSAGSAIAAHLNQHAADAVILISLASDHAKADAMTNSVLDNLGSMPVIAAVRADTHHVWEYDSAGNIDDTDPGQQRDTSATSAAIVQAVAAGQQIWASREDLDRQFEPLSRLTEVGEDAKATADGGVVRVNQLTAAAIDILTAHVTGREALSEGEMHTLAVAAQIVATRDTLWGLINRTNAEAHAEAWRYTATRTAGPQAAGPYALAGFGYWLAGDGARALMATERALAADADYNMAQLVTMVLGAGINPADWNGIPV